MNSAMPLGFALFGMLLLSVDPAPLSIWRWCSGFAFVGEVMAFVSMPNPRKRIPAVDLQAVNKFLFYGIGILATASAALQAVNFSVWNRFWPFFAAIFVHLSAAMIQFLRLLLLPPKSSSNS